MKFRYLSSSLRRLIPASGYEVEQVAEMLGYKSEAIVRMWMTGEHGPRLEQLPRIAGIIGEEVSFLLADWMADAHPEFIPQMQTMLAGYGLAVPDYKAGPMRDE